MSISDGVGDKLADAMLNHRASWTDCKNAMLNRTSSVAFAAIKIAY
jgi:hypothetical protein